MIDLKTTYLGLPIRNPLVCSSSPLCASLDHVCHMEEAGAAAIVLHSLFEEQLEIESQDLDRFLEQGTHSFAEASTHFPEMADYNLGIDGYLNHIRACKARVDIPIIASLNGSTSGGWIRYARELEQAGADALELNLYFMALDPTRDSLAVEAQYIDLVSAIKGEISIPLAVKLSSFFTAPVAFAQRLAQAGAAGIVLFNRFYQPDLDLDKLEVVPSLTLSNPHELLLRLHWAAAMFGHVEADLAITGGVHSGRDILKVLLAGGRVAMTTSALLSLGIDHLHTMLRDMTEWLVDHEYESVQQMQGSMSLKRVANPENFERVNYLRVLRSYSLRHQYL